jgi:hypothetical protein
MKLRNNKDYFLDIDIHQFSPNQEIEITNNWLCIQSISNAIASGDISVLSNNNGKTVMQIIADAMVYGNLLIQTFASENVLMGITQAGKTKDVSDFFADTTRYAMTGSLYEVINEVNRLKDAGLPSDLAPFVTEQRLNDFIAKVEDYLGI